MSKIYIARDELVSRLMLISFRNVGIATCEDGICLVRHAKANWLAELQDLLEDLQIPLDDFCNVAYSDGLDGRQIFSHESNRLRINDIQRRTSVVNVRALVGFIESAYVS